MADGEKPWADKSRGERASDIVGWLIMGAVLLGFAVTFMTIAVDEARWTFVKVAPNRVCAHGQRGNCLIRESGRVKEADGSWFTVTIDRSPYIRDATLSHEPAPDVGSVVVLEDWNGRLVSVLDHTRGRLHTVQWPNPAKDLLEAGVALTAVLVVPAVFFFAWLVKVIKRRRSGARIAVTAERARTS